MRIIFLFLFLSGVTLLPAQQSDLRRVTVAGFRVHLSKTLIHSKSIQNLVDTYPWGIEGELSRQFFSEKAWEICHCAPKAGVSLAFWNYDYPAVLGYGVNALSFIEPVYTPWRKLHLSIRLGMGLSWQSNPYHASENPDNQAYSLPVNFPLLVGIGLNFRLNTRWKIRAELNYNHVSNGGIKEPNKGLNYPSIALGAERAFSDPHPVNYGKRSGVQFWKERARVSATFFNTTSNSKPGGTQQFYILGFEGKLAFRYSRAGAIVSGTEGIWDFSLREKMREAGIGDAPFYRGSFFLGHEFWLGRVTFSTWFGFYYQNKWPLEPSFYQRYTLTTRIWKELYAGIGVKAQAQVADFIDLRLGWYLPVLKRKSNSE